jgi:hypothetical protein
MKTERNPQRKQNRPFAEKRRLRFSDSICKKDLNGSNAKVKYSFAPTITRSLVVIDANSITGRSPDFNG